MMASSWLAERTKISSEGGAVASDSEAKLFKAAATFIILIVLLCVEFSPDGCPPVRSPIFYMQILSSTNVSRCL
jgi:hypothetical protein